MRLAFRNWSFGFKLKEVPVTFNIGTIESVCKGLGLEFWQLNDFMKKNNYDFTVELLYQGYITACKDSYKKPKYTRSHAIVWHENMSKLAQDEFLEMMKLLFGDIEKMAGTKKKVKVEVK